MLEKVRKAALFLVIYALIFWVGFNSGAVRNRMKSSSGVERVCIPGSFYIVEKVNYGNCDTINFQEVDGNNVVIKFLQNENLKPLLKLRNISIYNAKGEKIY